MFKDLGRLALRDIKENELKVEKIFNYIDEKKIELAKSNIIKLLSTPNYFIRELVGKKLVEYPDGEKMDQIVLSLLGHKTYGVRAATVFYYYLKYHNDPNKIINLLDMSWSDTPWETEHILYEMWNKYPKIMKKEMSKWSDSQFEKQRALSYHGMEAIAADDPYFVLNTIEKNIDDNSIEVQKKITHVLSHVVRVRPAECYPFLRELLINFSDIRAKTIFMAMKKLIALAYQNLSNGKSSKSDEFYLLTIQTINDWKFDPVKSVSSVGDKLVSYSKNPNIVDQDFVL